MSILRFLSNRWIFTVKEGQNKLLLLLKTVILFLMNQIILILALYISYFANQQLFISLIAGVLLAPFVVIINSFTEALGITKNKFYID
ncbi:MAG: hypothetical protein Q8865_05125 [Bacillota bacterium]|nr:hypothetical protein [Bacillota bacterium]